MERSKHRYVEPLLATKLHAPKTPPGLVLRPRLVQKLDEALELGHRLILVSAPAGFGKTTLLSDWLMHKTEGGTPGDDAGMGAGDAASFPAPRLGVAWLTLDESDNDLARFLTYLNAALQKVGAGAGQRAMDSLWPGGLTFDVSPSPTPLLALLVNQVEALPGSLILVLDDYHTIIARPVHLAVEFLLDHLPGNMHLAIATRSDPPLPLPRLRGRGQLTELCSDDLRFTPGEAAHFLDQATGLTLAKTDVVALTARTEGWIAGLQMAATCIRGREDVSAFIQSFTGSHRFILDYLLEEVLQAQPQDIQDFMLQTSILERLTAPLCDAVLLAPSSRAPSPSQAMLEALERANLFIVPLDDERRWYRYHRLLTDLLRGRLQQVQPGWAPVLHRRASEWHEQQSLMPEAIHHALAAEDFDRAACLIQEQAEITWSEGRQGTLSAWLDALPDEQVTARPRLCIFHALVLSMTGRYHAAGLRLEAAEDLLDSLDAGPEVETQRGMVATVRALTAYFQGDLPSIIHSAGRALELLPQDKSAWRGSAALNLGDAHRWRGDMAAATGAYEQAQVIGQATGNTYLVMVTSVKQMMAQVLQGRLRYAYEMSQFQAQRLDETGWSQTPMAAGVCVVRADILREWNDLDGALRDAQKACDLGQGGGSAGLLGMSYLILARILWDRGEMVGSEEVVQKLETLAGESAMPVWITAGIAAWRAQCLAGQAGADLGPLRAGEQLLRERGVGLDDDIAYPRESEYLALARILVAQGRLQPAGPHLDEALELLARLRQRAEVGGRLAWVLSVLVLEALAFQAQGELNRALVPLARALALAEPEGYVRLFVDGGRPMAHLLRQAVARDLSPEYATRLLAAFGEELAGGELQRAPSGVLDPLYLVTEELSSRELEVLKLLDTSLSATEIAQELVVSVHTVRSHLRNIYEKLDVHSRYQAVARAKELGHL